MSTVGRSDNRNSNKKATATIPTAISPPSSTPRVQTALDSVPVAQREKWHGKCAEVGCASQAEADNVDFDKPHDAKAEAVNVRGDSHRDACGSCKGMNKNLGISQDG